MIEISTKLFPADLWLPSDLALGKTWSHAQGDFEVVGFDQTLTVNGVKYQGVLAYRHRSSGTWSISIRFVREMIA